MAENPPTTGRGRPTGPTAPVPLADGSEDEPPRLRSRVVAYPDGPNRCTICPPGLTGIERMERWLTANAHAFVDLNTWR